MKRFILISLLLLIGGILISVFILFHTPSTRRMITVYLVRKSLSKADLRSLIPDEEMRAKFKRSLLRFVKEGSRRNIPEEKIKELNELARELSKDGVLEREEVELFIKKMNEILACREKWRRSPSRIYT